MEFEFNEISFAMKALRVDDVMDIAKPGLAGEMEQALDDAKNNGWNPDQKSTEGKNSYGDFVDGGQSLIVNLYVAFNLLNDPETSGKYEITWKGYLDKIGLSDDIAQGLIYKWRDPEGYDRSKRKRKRRSGKSPIQDRIERVFKETVIEPKKRNGNIVTVEIMSGGVISQKDIDISTLIDDDNLDEFEKKLMDEIENG